MRFFLMRQDINLSYCMVLRDFEITKGGVVFQKKDDMRLKDSTALFLSGNGDEAQPDFIQHPVYMVSAKIQKILELCEDGLLFKDVVLIHQESSMQFRYHHILMDQLDVRSSKTEYYPDGTEKRLVLDSYKIGDHQMFLMKNSRIMHPLVSLSVVESLLRRNVMGILFDEVEVY